ncbi:MAG: ISNCY family transposase [Bacteroidales bacterium]
MEKIPCDPQIRNILDLIRSNSLNVVFERIYQFLQNGKHLQRYERLEKNLLICLDGTEYHSSSKISCECCSTRNHRNGKVTYSHTAILPVIAAPNCAEVISLPPEFVTPQDGHEKQDCETAAAKRWISKHRHLFQGQAITLLGDDLYSRQPMCQHCLDAEMNFIFTCLPSSHSSLYEWLDYLEKNGEVQHLTTKHRKGKSIEIYSYRFVNQIPLREQEPSLLVNWCELIVRDSADNSEVYRNAFVTNHAIDINNVAEIVEAGRCRWKTENENHNVLKTKGYNLEHNFGHGQKHLSSTLLSLNLLAFLFHTILHLIDSRYQEIRRKRGTRRGFFQDILSLTKYFIFKSWQHLIEFMLGDAPVFPDSC